MFFPWKFSRGAFVFVFFSSICIAWYKTSGIPRNLHYRKQNLFSSTVQTRDPQLDRRFVKEPLDIPPPLQPNRSPAAKTTVPYRHSEEIKRIISAANTGRVPWNAGSSHSEETKAKIRNSVLAKVTAEKSAKAAILGMSLEDYDLMQKNAKNERNRLAHKEKRKARLAALEAAGIVPQPRRVSRRPSSHKGRALSDETRMKIAKKVKSHWESGVYNNSKTNNNRNETIRAKIGEKLKQLWQDPEFRATQLSKRQVFTNETKALISMKIKEKWQDASYRDLVMKSIHARHNASNGNFIPRRSAGTSKASNADSSKSRRSSSSSRKSRSSKARSNAETDPYPLQAVSAS